MDLKAFKKLPIMGILRGIEADMAEPLAEAVVESGLKTIEITMNTPNAAELIRKMSDIAGDRLVIGAGTVLSMSDLRNALSGGARFIVLPTLVNDVVEHCVKNNIPVFPGALTPQEIYNAWRAGASMVKVFPAKFFGPVYFKEIKGPFNDIELLACGGVNSENIGNFFENKASAVAFGASIFKKQWLENKEFDKIKDSIQDLINVYERVLGD